MLVSVIIPVFNGEKYISKIYKSIKEQKYDNLEIIFFNDASKDNSLEILLNLKKNDKRIKVYSTEKNCGPGGAKNEGLKRATGKYVLFIDCDDIISDTYIKSLVETALKNNQPDMVLSNFTKIDSKGKVQYIRNYKNADKAFYQKISSVGKLIKRKYLLQNKIELPYGHVLEDILLHAYTSVSKTSYAYTEEAGYYYIYNENSISHTTLKSFKVGALDMAKDYLIKIKNNKKIKYKEKLDYYALKYVCWHLLKSGNKVGTKNMMNEYNNGFDFLSKEFPNYKKIKIADFKNERMIIKFVLFNILLMKKIKLDKLFFKIYSNVDLECFWPNL